MSNQRCAHMRTHSYKYIYRHFFVFFFQLKIFLIALVSPFLLFFFNFFSFVCRHVCEINSKYICSFANMLEIQIGWMVFLGMTISVEFDDCIFAKNTQNLILTWLCQFWIRGNKDKSLFFSLFNFFSLLSFQFFFSVVTRFWSTRPVVCLYSFSTRFKHIEIWNLSQFSSSFFKCWIKFFSYIFCVCLFLSWFASA